MNGSTIPPRLYPHVHPQKHPAPHVPPSSNHCYFEVIWQLKAFLNIKNTALPDIRGSVGTKA